MSGDLLFAHFIRLQNSAGLEPRLKAEDQWYGFHDLRRGFATNNYQALSALEVTQVTGDAARQPRHHESTTKRYINMAEKYAAAETTGKIFVPDVLQD